MAIPSRFARLTKLQQEEILKRRKVRSSNRAKVIKENLVSALKTRSPAEKLLALGINSETLKAHNMGVSYLQDNLSPGDLIKLGFTNKKDFLDRGCGFQALNYRQSGVSAKDLVRVLKFTKEELRSRYFGENEIQEAFKE